MFMFHPPVRAVENESIKERIKRLDLPGVAVFVPAIFMILLALQWGGITYAWSSSRIIGLFVGGGVTLILFGIYQWRKGDMAMIPPNILTNRTVLLASISAMWGMGAQSLFGLWMPEWFQVCGGSLLRDATLTLSRLSREHRPCNPESIFCLLCLPKPSPRSLQAD